MIMWDSTASWDQLVKGWYSQSFKTVNVKDCEAQADAYMRVVKRCEKNLP